MIRKQSILRTTVVALVALSVSSAFSAEISLSEVKQRLMAKNLDIRATAEQAYQSKLQITLARRNLLPRLNLAKLITTPLSVTGALGLIEDIAPFLFPANWAKVRETKYVSAASDQSFRAMKMNQVFMARSAALTVLADQMVLTEIENQYQTLLGWVSAVQLQEKLGQIDPGTSIDFERLALESERDAFLQRQGVQTELSELKYLFGIPQNESLVMRGDLKEIQEIPVQLRPNWAAYTPESVSYDYLVLASRETRRGFAFSVLGFTSNARGLTGGIFDSLPEPNGLGFGLGPTIQIAKKQTNIVQLQRQGSIQTQEKAYAQAVSMLDTQRRVIENAEARAAKIEEALAIMESRTRIGLPLDPNRLFELLRDRVAARVEATLNQLHLALAIERKHRIINISEYTGL